MGLFKNGISLVALLVIIFTPGYLTVISLLKGPTLEALGSIELLFMSFISGFAVTGLAAIFLAVAGLFNIWLLVVMLMAYAVCVALYFKPRRWLPRSLRPGKDWVIIPILLLALVLFVTPFRYVLGGHDKGIYTDIAGNLKRTGKITIDDASLKELSPAGRDILVWAGKTEVKGRVWDQGIYPFFYLTDKATMSVVPAAHYLYPAYLAFFMGFTGANFGLVLNTLLALLGVMALYFAAKELFDWRIGALAAFLLSICAVQVYFSRRAMTEMLTQVLVFSGLYFFSRFISGDARGREFTFLGVASGVLIGEAMFARADALVLIVPVGAWILYQGFVRGRVRRYLPFIASFVTLTALGVLVLSLLSTPYFVIAMRDLLGGLATPGAVAVVAGIMVIFVLLGLELKGQVRDLVSRYGERAARYLKFAAAAFLVLLFVYAMFLRPVARDLQTLGPKGNEVRQWAYYLSFLGLLLALYGYCRSIISNLKDNTYMFMSIGLIYTLFFGYNMLHIDLIMKMRRLVPVVMPAAMVMIAFAVFDLGGLCGHAAARVKRDWRKWADAGVTAVLVVALTVLIALPTMTVRGLHEGVGTYSLVSEMAAKLAPLKDNGIIMVDKEVGNLFSPPLLTFFGIATFPLMYWDNPQGDFASVVKDYLKKGKKVYMLWQIAPGNQPEMIGDLKPVPIAQFLYSDRKLEEVTDRKPRKVQEIKALFELVELKV